MSDELKSCPFCGRPFEIFEYPDDGTAHWLHNNADCPMHRDTSTGWLYNNAAGMVEELNRRPIEDALRVENARLREALHHIAYQSAAMSGVDFSWRMEWHNLRNEARAALEVKHE